MRVIKPRKLHQNQVIVDDEIKDYKDIHEESYNQNNNIYQGNIASKSDKISIPALIGLVACLSLISGFFGAYLVINTFSRGTTTSNGITTSTVKLSEPSSISDAVSKVYDSVVVVEVYNDNQMVSTGTGFVYKKENEKAYLMTNNHVISEGKEVKVLFTDDTEVTATVVGRDTYADIAVLSIKDNDKIVAAPMGDSSKSKVGDTVFTVGSPEGSDYAGTVTKGILSAQDRLVAVALNNSQTSDYYMQVLQTDAAINPGNSGGPICNTNGEVIGITNMKLVDDKVEGMGFAIPVEDALKVADILEKNGKVTRPYIGISMLDITNSYYLWQAGILVPDSISEGIAVVKVESGSPAEKAGLQKGDIITKIAGKKTSSLAEFRYELYKHSPEEEVEVTYVRNGKTETTKVQLGKGE